MSSLVLHLVNLLLPGTGLVLRDRVGQGVPLLLVALATVTVLILAPALAVGDLRMRLLLGAASIYAVAALTAVILLWRWERPWPDKIDDLDPRYRTFVRAWLGGDDPTAARRALDPLLRDMPGHPGVWRLLVLVAAENGDAGDANLAERRLARLARRRAVQAEG